jgi:hypothetical protein
MHVDVFPVVWRRPEPAERRGLGQGAWGFRVPLAFPCRSLAWALPWPWMDASMGKFHLQEAIAVGAAYRPETVVWLAFGEELEKERMKERRRVRRVEVGEADHRKGRSRC